MFQADPHKLDRTLAGYAEQRRRFTRALQIGNAEEHAFENLPRALNLELLEELESAKVVDPFAAGAEAWARELLLSHAVSGAEQRLSQAFAVELHDVDRPERGRFSVRQLRERALADGARRDGWLQTLAGCALGVRNRRAQLWEAEAEHSERLRATPARFGAAPEAELALSRQLLDSTSDAYREFQLESLTALIAQGLGRDVAADFPTRLGAQQLGALFYEGDWLRGLTPAFSGFEPVLGAASLSRALWNFGSAWHEAAADPKRPFVLRQSPRGYRQAMFAAMFALLPLTPAFLQRRLGVSRGRLPEAARALSRVYLLGARALSLSAELSVASLRGARAHSDAFAEFSERAFGFELPAELRGVLWERRHALTHGSALFEAALRHAELREEHDDDWFRNPRVIEELRAEALTPAALGPDMDRLQRGLATFVSLLNEGF